jgi:tetratricopeptide (TPR) repeat protein
MSDEAGSGPVKDALNRALAEIEKAEQTHGPLDGPRQALAKATATAERAMQSLAETREHLAVLARRRRHAAERREAVEDYRSLLDAEWTEDRWAKEEWAGNGWADEEESADDEPVRATAARAIAVAPGPDHVVPAAVATELCGLAPALTLAAGYLVDTPDPDAYLEAYRAAAPRLWELGVPAGCPEPVARAALLNLERLDETGRRGVELCACLDALDEVPLPRLLPEGGDLTAPTRLGLLRFNGSTFSLDPMVRRAIGAWLTPQTRNSVALLLLKAFPRLDAKVLNHPADVPDEPLLPALLRLSEPGAIARPGLAILLAERVAWYLYARGEFEAARAAGERALEIRRRVVPPDEDVPEELLALVVRTGEKLNDTTGVGEALDRALAVLAATYSKPTRSAGSYASELVSHARLRRSTGDFAGARVVLDRALAADPTRSAADLALLAEVCAESGDLDSAVAVYRRVLASQERRYGPDDLSLLATLRRLGELLSGMGDLPAARAVLDQALGLLEREFLEVSAGDGSPGGDGSTGGSTDGDGHEVRRRRFGSGYGWVGRAQLDVVLRLGDPAGVASVVDRLLALYLPTLDSMIAFDPVLDDVVNLLAERGEPALACATLDRIIAAKASAQMYGPDHSTIFTALERIVDLQRRQADPAAVVGTMRRLVELTALRYGEQHKQLGPALLRLGEAIEESGDHDEALRTFGRAFNLILEYWGGPGHPSTCAFATDVGLAVHRTGDLDRAKVLLENAVLLNTKLDAERNGESAQETVRALRAYVAVLDELGDPATEPRERLARIDPASVPAPQSRPSPEAERIPASEVPASEVPASEVDDEIERMPVEELPQALMRFNALADQHEQAGAPDDAIRAVDGASAVLRRQIAQLSDDDPQAPYRWGDLYQLLSRKFGLLIKLRRNTEARRLTPEMAVLSERMNDWQVRAQDETKRRVAEVERRGEFVRRRVRVASEVSAARATPERLAAVRRRMTGTATPAEAVDLHDAPARLASAEPAARELVTLCAFLDPEVPFPLDQLTVSIDLLPEALRTAAEADLGLRAPLDSARRLGLLAGDGVAARMHPAVSEAVRGSLSPHEAAHAWRRAALLVLAAPVWSIPAEDDEPERQNSLAQSAIRLADENAGEDPVIVVLLLDKAIQHSRDPERKIELLERNLAIREAIFLVNELATADMANQLAELLAAEGAPERAAAVLERLIAAGSFSPGGSGHTAAVRRVAELRSPKD